MDIIDIGKVADITYPLSRETYDNINIVYHGTSNNYTAIIEDEGWQLNKTIYNIEDIKMICDLFESISYFDQGWVILRSYTLGPQDYHLKRKKPCFACDYWTARNYAALPGGETLNGLAFAVDKFIECTNSTPQLDAQIKKVKEKLDEFKKNNKVYLDNLKIHGNKNPEIEQYLEKNLLKYGKALDIWSSKEKLSEVIKRVQNIKEKYSKYVEDHTGIIYAVKVEPEWFDNWREPTYYTHERFGIEYKRAVKEVNLFAKQAIPAENIIAKIILPKGIITYFPDSLQPLPLPWTMDLFKKYLQKRSWSKSNEEFCKEYLNV